MPGSVSQTSVHYVGTHFLSFLRIYNKKKAGNKSKDTVPVLTGSKWYGSGGSGSDFATLFRSAARIVLNQILNEFTYMLRTTLKNTTSNAYRKPELQLEWTYLEDSQLRWAQER